MANQSESPAKQLLASLRERTDDAEFFHELGATFGRHGLLDFAKAAFETALQIDSSNGFTHLRLGNCYYRERQYEAALECFESARDVMPDSAAPLWCLADVYECLRRYKTAANLHRRSVALDPSDRQARRLYRKFRRRREGKE